VCGCDGHIYNNACTATAAGIDLNTNGGCPALPDFIPCGANYCDAHTSYCEIYLSDVFDLPSGRYCRPLPASCLPTQNPKPTCSCFPKQTPCLSFCGPMPTGGIEGFHLTCQGVHDPN
jgi:hypothetical protein